MMTPFTTERLLERAAFIDRQIETWKGNPGYADTLRMEAWALKFAAAAPAAIEEACLYLPQPARYDDAVQSPEQLARLVLEPLITASKVAG